MTSHWRYDWARAPVSVRGPLGVVVLAAALVTYLPSSTAYFRRVNRPPAVRLG